MKKPDMMMDMMRMQGKDVGGVNEETGYMLRCGECHDPCALKWKMDHDHDDMMMMDPEMVLRMGGAVSI